MASPFLCPSALPGLKGKLVFFSQHPAATSRPAAVSAAGCLPGSAPTPVIFALPVFALPRGCIPLGRAVGAKSVFLFPLLGGAANQYRQSLTPSPNTLTSRPDNPCEERTRGKIKNRVPTYSFSEMHTIRQRFGTGLTSTFAARASGSN